MIAFRRFHPALPLLLGALLLACDDDALDPAEGNAVALITLRPERVTLQIGQNARLSAVLQDAGGEVLEDQAVDWTSSNPEVATVVAGVVTGVQIGEAVITASAGERSAEARVTVQLAVSEILLTPEAPVIAQATSVQLKATLRSPDGRPIGDRVVQWSSLNPRIATVSVGKVRGLRIGTAEIIATADDRTASTTVTVVPNINGPWILGSFFGDAALGIACTGSGLLTAVQSGGSFTGQHDLLGSCETPAGPIDVTGVLEVQDAGLSAGALDFQLRGGLLTCGYRGAFAGTPVSSAAGEVICSGDLAGERVSLPGTWEMRR